MQRQMRQWVLNVTCLAAFLVVETSLVLLGTYGPYTPDDIFWTTVIVVPPLIFGGIPLVVYWERRRRG